jgi:hypothetical protein
MFGVTELMVSEEEITDVEGRRLAEIQRPQMSLRRFFSASRDGLGVVRPDGMPLLRLEKPEGERIRSLWVEAPEGARIGVIKGRRRLVFAGGDHDVHTQDGKVIGTARSGRMLDTVQLTDAAGASLAVGARQGETWTVELQPAVSDDWTRFTLAFVIATELVRFQQDEWS